MTETFVAPIIALRSWIERVIPYGVTPIGGGPGITLAIKVRDADDRERLMRQIEREFNAMRLLPSPLRVRSEDLPTEVLVFGLRVTIELDEDEKSASGQG